jgi:hypothetical protein
MAEGRAILSLLMHARVEQGEAEPLELELPLDASKVA